MRGTLEVTVVSARELRNVETFGKVDPFVTLTVDKKHSHKTQVVKNSRAPSWQEHFSFDVPDGYSNLHLECYDYDYLKANDFIGAVVIPLGPAMSQGSHDSWYPLLTKHGKPAGDIYIEMDFKR